MNSGAMFGNLDFYADETYYQEHPFAYLQTEDSIQEYRIVTVLKADRNLFPFQQKLADAEAVQEYLKAAKQREVFETGDDYLKCIYDKVLTLVTCSYEWSGARNIVWRCRFPGQCGVRSVRKYQKSAENETNNDRTGRDVFKTGGLCKGVHW